MSTNLIIQEATVRTHDGREIVHFEVFDVCMLAGRAELHKRSDVGFNSREEAEAWIAQRE